MIQKVEINNFRGMEHAEFQDMRRLCLISGRNNVGKSSVLEAIFLFMDHISNDSFAKLNSFRGNNIANGVEMWEPLFHNMDLNAPITISAAFDKGNNAALTYDKDSDYLPIKTTGVPDEVIAQFRSDVKESYSLSFRYIDNDYEETGHFITGSEGILRQMTTNLPDNEIRQMLPTRFINAAEEKTMDAVLEGIGKLELEGRKREIKDILKVLDPAIEDIVTISRQSRSMLHIRSHGKWIPLQYAGNGVLKLLQICLAIMELENGLLLIDEIETGFHYSMYGALWKAVEEISEKTNCQVIATTHSYEMIGALTHNVLHSEDFVYYRMGKKEGNTIGYRFNYDVLCKALSTEMEVR